MSGESNEERRGRPLNTMILLNIRGRVLPALKVLRQWNALLFIICQRKPVASFQAQMARLNSESSVSSGSSSFCSDPVNFSDQDKAHHGLPELFDKCWWIKNFFHSEPSSPNVNGKTISTSSVAS
ncbi:pancreatic progenitor cell differentiation and proliferation factor-like protein isoform X1 [Mauremys mutica]|uniref:pancreatic progenitor cell differentiation and proliferation factor-like protein isoform X1 n=1 Tax=Mauremys mutica TaxID=74926 RepID=UPI001D16BC98|nr:pancreatic progenitor cell differentiation and proliferation factor-like protein isoform X1 [Mauremys mutica]